MTPDQERQERIASRTEALVQRAEEIRQSIVKAADELAAMTRELRVLLADQRGGTGAPNG